MICIRFIIIVLYLFLTTKNFMKIIFNRMPNKLHDTTGCGKKTVKG